MKLTNLKYAYDHIKAENQTFCIFPFKKNNVEFDIYFDISKKFYSLGFMVKYSKSSIWFDITRDFQIDASLDSNLYYLLIKILNIKKTDSSTPFSTLAFFDEFNKKIPLKFQPLSDYNDLIVRVAIEKNSIENPDKLCYLGQIDWDAPINKGKGSRTDANLEKTRQLYPRLYELTKDRNISIRYAK